MININYIIKRGRRYIFYDEYETYKEAIEMAKHYKKTDKTKYYIIAYEKGLIPRVVYRLYMNKVFKW